MIKGSTTKIVGVVFLVLLVTSTVLFIDTAGGLGGPLYLKWTKYLGTKAGTYIAPLAADLNGDGKMEIVVVGGTADYGSDGTVTVLDGATGKILWQVSPGGIGMHTPFEIADLNGDGKKEIVIESNLGAMALFGNNGSLYWLNTDANAGENYPAVADVDGDGHPEVFVCRGYGPYSGYDYITELSYNGTILNQAWNWHPCWGGLSIVDPNNDGNFILLEGDRSSNYNPAEDPYKYGGMGVRALDARTLKPLWNDSDILSSSHAPMLADVNKDGKLEVIAAWQSSGLVVLSATTGAVDTTGGIYRKQANVNMSFHSQPTVGTFDTSRDVEIIDGEASNPKIFDLYTWKLRATLPFVTQEPPKAGYVTGIQDGLPDIIAVTMSTPNAYIFHYNGTRSQYDLIQTLSYDPKAPSGLLYANAFSLVQDVDGDGLNELVLTSSNGYVYCYDTPAPATTPPTLSSSQFYSELRGGVAQYVPPLGPLSPQIVGQSPSDGATNVQITISQLGFTLKDFQGNSINYTVTTSPYIGSSSGINVLPGQYSVSINNLQYGTTYYWTVTATDRQNTNTQTYSFTTAAPPPATPWWNANWLYRRKITIKATAINSGQTNFPLLIDITDTNFTSLAQPSGIDFVFADATQKKLNHEVEYYNSSSGHLIAWVSIPFLSSVQNTVLYLYYGNPVAIDQQNPSAVWDQNFTMVQHMNQGNGTNFDSTSNGNNGTPSSTGVVGATGEIDGAESFDGKVGYVLIPDSPTLAGYSQGFTASFWTEFNDVSRRQTLLSKFNQSSTTSRSWFIEFSPTNGLGLFASSDGATYAEWHTPSFKPAVGVWYHITIVWKTNSVPQFYVNDQQLSVLGSSKISQIFSNVGIPLAIGTSTYTSGRQFNGTIDEIRLSNIPRSPGWIQTCYNIEADATAIYTLSAQETFAAAGLALANPSPSDGAIGVGFNPVLTIAANDYQGNLMNITFRSNATGSWKDLGTYTNVGNGVYTLSVTNMNNYGTTYYWGVYATDGTYFSNVTYSFTTKTLALNWWDSNWEFRRKITIDHTKVQASQSNFPLLVDLTDNVLPSKAQPNGNDFVFVNSNGTKLDHEIENFDNVSGHLTAWVRISFLSSTQDTVLYLYYGNPLAANEQNATGVWDSNYKMVQHLGQVSSIVKDSTSNGYNANVTGGVTKTSLGQIDGAVAFDGSSGDLQSNITAFGQKEIMVESWVYITSIPSTPQFAKTHMYGRTLPAPLYWYGMWMGVSNTSPLTNFAMTIRLYNPSGSGSIISYSYGVSLLDQWVHIAFGFSEITNKTYFYVNGFLAKSDNITSPLNSGFITPLDDSLVKGFSLGSNIMGTEFVKMMGDEIRISNSIRSPSWIITNYNNQNNQSSFYALGAEELSP